MNNVKLTKRQKWKLDNLKSKRSKQLYLKTLTGKTKQRIKVKKFDSTQIENQFNLKNRILGLFQATKCIQDDHKPVNVDLGHWVGVEIECFFPSGVASDEEELIDLIRSELRKDKINRVTIKNDGSLSDDNDGCDYALEICYVFNTKNGFEGLKSLLEILNGFEAYVNETCGLHVHLDMRHLKNKSQLKTYSSRLRRVLNLLAYTQPRERRENDFCKLGVSKEDDRYYAINTLSFNRHKTIEVRLHGGTTNFKKISSWIKLLNLIKNTPNKKDVRNFQDFIDFLKPDDKLVEYVESRVKLYGPHLLTGAA